MTRILLVHGAFHGGWCWEKVIPELNAHGLEAEALDLPFTSHADDVAEVANAIDRLTAPVSGAAAPMEPLVVVGHSFGGTIITAAAGGDFGTRAASHLVYLTAKMRDPATLSEPGQTPGRAAIVYGPEEVFVDPAQATMAFYHRCDPADAAWATSRLRSMPLGSLRVERYPAVAWRTVPSTYIVCTDDQILSPDAQRGMVSNAGATVEMDSDHSPFSLQPDRAGRDPGQNRVPGLTGRQRNVATWM
jgi:pimeloyl-ACP methyl ester carboxylesterase